MVQQTMYTSAGNPMFCSLSPVKTQSHINGQLSTQENLGQRQNNNNKGAERCKNAMQQKRENEASNERIKR